MFRDKQSKAIYETAKDLAEIGAMNAQDMREIEDYCLVKKKVQVRTYSRMRLKNQKTMQAVA